MKGVATAGELSRQLEAREVSAVELARRTLNGIERNDVEVGAFLSTAQPEQLLEEAEAIDRARRQGEHDSPFAGVPIAVKDNIAVAGEPLTCGSRILDPYRAAYDATAVERLRAAGLLIVGKTNMDEFEFGSSTENSAFQVTRNPRDLDRVPGGTSGGSAAAVCAGLVPWALGTDTGGSVRQPASLCGVVGMRPTYGRVSRYGLVAYASSMDQIGPIANCVADTRALLSIVAGRDRRDSTSLPDAAAVQSAKPNSITIGVPEEYHAGDCDPDVRAATDLAASAAERLGWRVKSVSLPLTRYALSAYYLISSVEASSNLGRYDGVRYGSRSSHEGSWLEMLTATRREGFGDEAKRRIMLGTFASSAGYHDQFYDNARRTRTKILKEFGAAFREVDLLLSPVSPSTAWPIGQRVHDPMKMYLSDVFSVPAALAGIPAMVIPVGDDRGGLPIGMQLAGPPLADEVVGDATALLEAELGYPHGQGFIS